MKTETVRAGRTKSRARGRNALLIVITVLAGLVMILAAAVPASATQHPLTPTDFTPKLKVETSTAQAGAPFDLTVGMEKKMNNCAMQQVGSNACLDGFINYLEQNLKKMVLELPTGIAPDVNAAPYCDVRKVPNPDPAVGPAEVWECANRNAAVGRVNVLSTLCLGEDSGAQCMEDSQSLNDYGAALCPNIRPPTTGMPPWLVELLDPSYELFPEGTMKCFSGIVYNERPRENEQGRLTVLIPDIPEYRQLGIYWVGWLKIDVSITVDGRLAMKAVADDMPDVIELNPSGIGTITAQVFDFKMTLKGDTGAERGHPLLSNPTSCEPKRIDAEFTGYKNIYPYGNPASQGTGGGKTVASSAPFQATGCDTLPYTPTFSASTGSQAPGSSPSLTTTIAQHDGQANTKRVEVSFHDMGINLATKLKPCAADLLAANSCPESSLMGTATATSSLLPVDGGPMTGNVYLTEIKGSSFGLSMFLNTASGFLNEPLRIDGTAGIKDGRVVASFNDLPDVPLKQFKLSLEAGAKSLLKMPSRCGNSSIKATFTSHSGKVHTVNSPITVSGCSQKLTFDADLSERSQGKRTSLELEVNSSYEAIKEVTFGIDRHMKLSTKGIKTRKLGEISLSTGSDTKTAALKRGIGAQKRNKSLSLRASTLGDLGVNLFRKRLKRAEAKKFKARSNRKRSVLKKKTVPKNRAAVKSLPKGTTRVTLTLNQDEKKLLRNSKKKCRTNFLALVKTADGTKYARKASLKLRGKGCSKKSSKNKKSVKGGK